MNLLTVKDRMNERLAKVTSAAKNFKVRDKLKTVMSGEEIYKNHCI